MSFSTGDSVLDSTLTDWLRWDQNPESKSFIEKLIESNNVDELRNRLLKRMEFGTAGLRAKMGAGNSMMNDLTIIQTSQGLAMYLVSSSPHVIEKGVMIGFDARHNSQRFAQLAAIAFLQKNIPVYLFSQICPTPFVPYATVKLGCVCGIMVTASHNPKEDNGYKVYWENGAQIISPHDKGISKSITENQEPWPEAWKTDSLDSNPLLKQPFEEIKSSYFQELQKICFFKELNPSSPLKFTYTAMHGVGYLFAVSAFEAFHFKPFTPVLEQIVPDPEFPTVKFPNPEEGKSALDYAMKTADENHSMVILANDPDADRLAVAEKQPSGEWHVFTGNELGALFGWWLWFTFKKANPTETGADVYMFASTVSSKILHSMSKKEGFNYEETLTGFKWMGNRSHTVIQEKKRVVFAFEEAIGFMCGSMVLDKDGVSAVAVCAEMATYLYHNNLTIMKQLDKIYEMYGYHVSNNSYFICHHPPTIKSLFDNLRNYEGSGKYPSSCGPYEIKHVRDLTAGYDSSQPDGKPILPTSKSSQMITFSFVNGCVLTMRTSGTEPKIKYYSEYVAEPDSGKSKKEIEDELADIVQHFIDRFLQPEKYNLIARTS